MTLRSIRSVVGAVLLVGVTVGIGPGGVAGAAPDPALSLTADPPSGVPGDVVTLTFTGCTLDRAVGVYQFEDGDTIAQIEIPLHQTAPGVFEGPFTLPARDPNLFAICGTYSAPNGVAPLTIDVESRVIELIGDGLPIAGYVPSLAYAEGTDCPAGGEAEVTFVHDGGVTTVVHATPDADGTWLAKAPANEKASGFTVTATCGGVTYEEAEWYGGAAPAPPPLEATPGPVTPTTAASVAPSAAGQQAVPATPVEADATFTG